ncbi:ECF transporter S component [Alkaliphilus sp. B6464]|uniref:ECF transporter S component n=1 Tax=Alkaliphilus sp. B6464 TaxID=2731219 RepID=UPI001BACBF20|nr:ECF transporter S component [Alkaliphilus sp. B6464]QUH20643.1 ECF transporter S component [Alkaliphilus sp. B6464]
MKKIKTLELCIIALGIATNFIGGATALALKLPIYLDTIGTIMIGALLGPIYGMIAGLLSGLISGITTDIYALYFSPVQIITGLMAGLLFRTNLIRKWKMPIGALLVTIPGTIVSSVIAAIIFGGVTSSGSSIIVQVLNKLGLNMALSIFMVQVVTDYLDRFIGIILTYAVLAGLPSSIKNLVRRKEANGEI